MNKLAEDNSAEKLNSLFFFLFISVLTTRKHAQNDRPTTVGSRSNKHPKFSHDNFHSV